MLWSENFTWLYYCYAFFRYPFRQNTDFLYLTGFQEPDAVLVLRKLLPKLWVEGRYFQGYAIFDQSLMKIKQFFIVQKPWRVSHCLHIRVPCSFNLQTPKGNYSLQYFLFISSVFMLRFNWIQQAPGWIQNLVKGSLDKLLPNGGQS